MAEALDEATVPGANREGRLTPDQARSLRSAALGPRALSLLIVGVPAILIAMAQWSTDPSTVAIVALLLVALGAWAFAATRRDWAEIDRGQVMSVTKRYEAWEFYGRGRGAIIRGDYLLPPGEAIPGPRSWKLALRPGEFEQLDPDATYRVFYLPRSRTVVSFEKVSGPREGHRRSAELPG
jgi:hypothetical protein